MVSGSLCSIISFLEVNYSVSFALRGQRPCRGRRPLSGRKWGPQKSLRSSWVSVTIIPITSRRETGSSTSGTGLLTGLKSRSPHLLLRSLIFMTFWWQWWRRWQQWGIVVFYGFILGQKSNSTGQGSRFPAGVDWDNRYMSQTPLREPWNQLWGFQRIFSGGGTKMAQTVIKTIWIDRAWSGSR